MNENQNLGPPQITAIVAFSKGFACSCGPGTVAWFEKTDDREYFKKAREIKIPQENNSADPSKAEQQIVSAMAVSPSEETLVVVTDMNQLYQITLSSAELGRVSYPTQCYYAKAYIFVVVLTNCMYLIIKIYVQTMAIL